MIADAREYAGHHVYLESSAALSSILREPSTAAKVDAALRDADRIFMASLAVVECHRVILRAVARGRLTAIEAGAAQYRLQLLLERSDLIDLEPSVIARASAPMGDNLIRSLDAIHVASAIVAREAVGPITFLSFDIRVRIVAQQLGFIVTPPELPPG